MRKPKLQFSKLHVIFADSIVLLVYAGSFILSWFDKTPVSDVALAIITVYGAFATGGYFTQNCIRDCSLNKHGINKEDL